MDVIIYDWFVLMMTSLTDGDVGDVQPSDELLDLYYYKLNQLVKFFRLCTTMRMRNVHLLNRCKVNMDR